MKETPPIPQENQLDSEVLKLESVEIYKYPNQEVLEGLAADDVERVKEILELAELSHIRYRSNDHWVEGYALHPKNVDNAPVVIYNHGGVSDTGTMDKLSLIDSPVTSSLLKAGNSIIASQYSGNGQSQGFDENGGSDVDDVLNLHNALKEESEALPGKYDMDKIVMLGESRGGMMTYLALCNNPEWLKAAVAMCAPADIRRLINDRPAIGELLEKTFPLLDEELDKRSASVRYDEISKEIPLLIVHSEDDDRVSVKDSKELHDKLKSTHSNCELKLIDGDGHFIGRNPEITSYIANWIKDIDAQ